MSSGTGSGADVRRGLVAVEDQLVVAVDRLAGGDAGVDVAGVHQVLHTLAQLAAVIEHLLAQFVGTDVDGKHGVVLLRNAVPVGARGGAYFDGAGLGVLLRAVGAFLGAGVFRPVP